MEPPGEGRTRTAIRPSEKAPIGSGSPPPVPAPDRPGQADARDDAYGTASPFGGPSSPSSPGAVARVEARGTVPIPPIGRRPGGLRFILRRTGIDPAARLAWAGLAVAARLAAGAGLDALRPAAGREARRRARRRRAAQRVVRTLGALKGVYAKAGQFASVRHDLLPAEVGEELAALQDRVPPLAAGPIRAAVEAELGAPIETLFDRFDPTPVGAASVAQVHRARLADGREVAVKVQYPWIREALPADLAVLRGAVALGAWLLGRRSLDRERFFQEFAEGLEEELDFRREARVAGEIARNLASDPRIVVPRIVAERTSRAVLTMTFHDAIRIDDRAGLTAAGVRPGAVLEILARAYARQVFVDGLFHADPHPGNLFVLPPSDDADFRVLFVDFGLSKHLSPALRREIRHGLYAVIQRDVDAFVARMDGMDMIAPGAHAGVRTAVESMFGRIAASSEGGALGLAGGQILGLKDEAVTLLRETPGLQLPNDLLLYAKTLSYLFALGDQLDPDVDLVKLTLPYLLRFLAEKDPALEDAAG